MITSDEIIASGEIMLAIGSGTRQPHSHRQGHTKAYLTVAVTGSVDALMDRR
jgi:hypothetical protein